MQGLKDRVALVLGAGSTGDGIGNGRASCIRLAREGARVVAVDLRLAAAQRTCAMAADEAGICVPLAADVSDGAQVARAVRETVERFGRVDVLVNNVGVVPLGGPIELDEADWDRAFAVNVKSAFLACKHALPHMLRQGRGAIVNVSSVASIRSPATAYCAYTASKAALNGLSHSIASQHAAQGVRSNVLLLGLIDTPHVREQLATTHPEGVDALMAVRHQQSPTGAMGSVWDVAAAVAFLASDDSAYINGAELAVDAGLHQRVGVFASSR